MIKNKNLLSVLLVVIFIAASGFMMLFGFSDTASALQFPIFTIAPPTLPPFYFNFDWKYIDTASGAGHFNEVGGLSVSDTNILAVGEVQGPQYEIHIYDGHTWKKHNVNFKPTGLEWSRSNGYLYASDYANDAVWMTSNPMADSPIWIKIAGSGSAVGQFNAPFGMFATTGGTLYVIDQNNRRIQYYSGGTWKEKTAPSDNIAMVDICITSRATWVTDTLNHKIYYQNPFSTTWESITDPLLSYPTYMSNDSAGNLYIAAIESDTNKYILKWTSEGFSKYVPSGTGPGYMGGDDLILQEIDVNYHDKLFYVDNTEPRLIKETCKLTDIGSIDINGQDLQLTGSQTINWSVDAQIDEAIVNALPLCNYASISGNGTYPLNFGVNAITLICSPESGASESYTLNITRELSDNALLSEISFDSVPIEGFIPNIFAYTGINVPFSTTSVEIAAVPQDANATVTGTGTIPLNVGENPMLLLVMAQDEITVQQYILTINREAEAPTATPSPSPTPSTSPTPTPTTTPTSTPAPTPTQSTAPTATPGATATPAPTATPEPTQEPTSTPAPSETTAPTPSSEPSATPTLTVAPGGDDSTGPDEDEETAEDLLKKQFRRMWLFLGLGILVVAGGGIFAGIMIGKRKK